MTLMKGIVTTLCIGCVAIGTGLAQSRPTAPITLTVDTASHGYAIPADFSGLSFERGTLNTNNAGAAGYLFSPTNTQLVTLFQNLSIKSLRVGGGSVDDEVPVGFNPDGFLGIDSLFDFAQAAGTKVIYTMRLLNTSNAYPNLKTMDATVASHIWQRNSSLLENFALGNEPDFHSYHSYCTNTGCTCTYPTGCTGTPLTCTSKTRDLRNIDHQQHYRGYSLPFVPCRLAEFRQYHSWLCTGSNIFRAGYGGV